MARSREEDFVRSDLCLKGFSKVLNPATDTQWTPYQRDRRQR